MSLNFSTRNYLSLLMLISTCLILDQDVFAQATCPVSQPSTPCPQYENQDTQSIPPNSTVNVDETDSPPAGGSGSLAAAAGDFNSGNAIGDTLNPSGTAPTLPTITVTYDNSTTNPPNCDNCQAYATVYPASPGNNYTNSCQITVFLATSWSMIRPGQVGISSGLQFVLIHEILHCLGMGHAVKGSPNATQSVMYPSISGSNNLGRSNSTMSDCDKSELSNVTNARATGSACSVPSP